MAAYTAIRERSATDLSIMKQHLRIDSSETGFDTLLEMYLTAAKQMADDYCQNPFTRYISGVKKKQPIPGPIEVWIMKTVTDWYTFPEKDTTEVEVDGTNRSRRDLSYDVTYGMLKPYRREVGFGLFW